MIQVATFRKYLCRYWTRQLSISTDALRLFGCFAAILLLLSACGTVANNVTTFPRPDVSGPVKLYATGASISFARRSIQKIILSSVVYAGPNPSCATFLFVKIVGTSSDLNNQTLIWAIPTRHNSVSSNSVIETLFLVGKNTAVVVVHTGSNIQRVTWTKNGKILDRGIPQGGWLALIYSSGKISFPLNWTAGGTLQYQSKFKSSTLGVSRYEALEGFPNAGVSC